MAILVTDLMEEQVAVPSAVAVHTVVNLEVQEQEVTIA